MRRSLYYQSTSSTESLGRYSAPESFDTVHCSLFSELLGELVLGALHLSNIRCVLYIHIILKSRLRKDIIMLWNNKYVIKALYITYTVHIKCVKMNENNKRARKWLGKLFVVWNILIVCHRTMNSALEGVFRMKKFPAEKLRSDSLYANDTWLLDHIISNLESSARLLECGVLRQCKRKRKEPKKKPYNLCKDFNWVPYKML